jgi:hypothetical protein
VPNALQEGETEEIKNIFRKRLTYSGYLYYINCKDKTQAQRTKTMNYRLTAITFPSYELAAEFATDNIDTFIEIMVDGLKQSFNLFTDGINWTVVFTKKVKHQVKESTRKECNKLINELGFDWEAVRINGQYTVVHGRNGKPFKKGKAKSWRGLKTVIKNLAHNYFAAENKIEWLRVQGITA